MQEGNEGEDAGAGSSRPQNASNNDGDDGDDSDDSDYEPVEVLSESFESEDDVDDDDEYLGDGPDAEENEHDQWERELGVEWNNVRQASAQPAPPAFDWNAFALEPEPHGQGAPKHWAQWVAQLLPLPDGCEAGEYSELEGITELGKKKLMKAMGFKQGEVWDSARIKEKLGPVHVWSLFMPDEMLDKIVDETNVHYHYIRSVHAPPNLRRGRSWPPKWTENWTPLTRAELKVALGVMYAYGTSKCCGIKRFYSTKYRASYSRPPVCDMMSRNRFAAIKAALHFRNEHRPLQPGTGDMRKLGNLLELFEKQCKEVYRAAANVALDEMMIRFEGNFAFVHRKQHKPTSEGMKMYAIACSKTGYTICFMLDERDGKTRIEDFVTGLAKKLPGDWNEIFMDNLFTSASVLKTLRAMKKHATGTVRAARRGYAPELATQALHWEKAPPPQGSYQMRLAPIVEEGRVPGQRRATGRLASYLWMDSGPAKLMSNRWGTEMGTVLRRVRGFASRQQIMAPLAFVLYNMHMGGVDIADALRSYLTTAAVTNKWYIAVFYWILDVAAVNAWIVYAHVMELTEKQRGRGRSDFQDLLVAGLTKWSGDGVGASDEVEATQAKVSIK